MCRQTDTIRASHTFSVTRMPTLALSLLETELDRGTSGLPVCRGRDRALGGEKARLTEAELFQTVLPDGHWGVRNDDVRLALRCGDPDMEATTVTPVLSLPAAGEVS